MIGMILIDFRKAFDLVYHTLLLKNSNNTRSQKRLSAGFLPTSYNTLSEAENIICGVPQGSIFGPLLFLLFINALPLNINSVLTDLYADDTTHYCIDKSQACIEQQLQIA